MVIILAQTQSLLFGIEPLNVNWPFSAIDDLAFETIDSLFSISEGPELNQGAAHEFLVLFHELYIENDAISLKEFPDFIFTPSNWQVTDIHNKFDSFGSKFLSGGDGAVGAISGMGGVAFIELLVGGVGGESFAGVLRALVLCIVVLLVV
jgi:hypothetical protein